MSNYTWGPSAVGDSSGPTAVQPLAEIYDGDRHTELFYESRDAPINNLGLAARFLIQLCRRSHIPYAFLGGWAIFLRGGPRAPQDLDIVVGWDVNLVRDVLLTQRRVCLPATNQHDTMQIFINTGGHWDPNASNTPTFTVCMDIFVNGKYIQRCSRGTPPSLPTGTVNIVPAPRTPQGSQAVPVIDTFHQVSGKLQAFAEKWNVGSPSDYTDLDYMIRTHHQEVYSFAPSINQNHRFLFWHDFAAQNTHEVNQFMKAILHLNHEEEGSTS